MASLRFLTLNPSAQSSVGFGGVSARGAGRCFCCVSYVYWPQCQAPRDNDSSSIPGRAEQEVSCNLRKVKVHQGKIAGLTRNGWIIAGLALLLVVMLVLIADLLVRLAVLDDEEPAATTQSESGQDRLPVTPAPKPITSSNSPTPAPTSNVPTPEPSDVVVTPPAPSAQTPAPSAQPTASPEPQYTPPPCPVGFLYGEIESATVSGSQVDFVGWVRNDSTADVSLNRILGPRVYGFDQTNFITDISYLQAQFRVNVPGEFVLRPGESAYWDAYIENVDVSSVAYFYGSPEFGDTINWTSANYTFCNPPVPLGNFFDSRVPEYSNGPRFYLSG